MQNRNILLIFGMTMLMLLANAQAKDIFSIGYDISNPPYAWSTKNGSLAGFYPILTLKAFMRMGYSINLEAKPWKRALTDAENCRSGIVGIYKNDDRLKKFDYSDPILTENMAMYFKSSNPIEFSRVEDLTDKIIGIRRGWVISTDFQAALRAGKVKVEEVDTDEANFVKLSRGRIDIVLTVEQTGDSLLSKYPNIKKSQTLFSSSPSYLVFCKSANMHNILSRFNKEMAAMRRDGSFEQLLRQNLN
nr:transporter substrate-binding domain-containing protein [uncultured Pseudogulbenkiania sp.]